MPSSGDILLHQGFAWRTTGATPPDAFAAIAAKWAEDGVRMIGGCCGLGPEHIRAAAERLGG